MLEGMSASILQDELKIELFDSFKKQFSKSAQNLSSSKNILYNSENSFETPL